MRSGRSPRGSAAPRATAAERRARTAAAGRPPCAIRSPAHATERRPRAGSRHQPRERVRIALGSERIAARPTSPALLASGTQRSGGAPCADRSFSPPRPSPWRAAEAATREGERRRRPRRRIRVRHARDDRGRLDDAPPREHRRGAARVRARSARRRPNARRRPAGAHRPGHAGGRARRAWVEIRAGIPTLGRGETAALTQELEPGRYALICFLDGPSGKPHFMDGMIKLVDVEGETDAAAPEADATLTLGAGSARARARRGRAHARAPKRHRRAERRLPDLVRAGKDERRPARLGRGGDEGAGPGQLPRRRDRRAAAQLGLLHLHVRARRRLRRGGRRERGGAALHVG